MTLNKTFSFGKFAFNRQNRKMNAVEVEVILENDNHGRPVFGASGNIWNHIHSDVISCGQNLDMLATYIRDPLFSKIFGWWLKWHNNDLKAGTPEQEAAITKWRLKGNKYDYGKACDYLKSIGLYEVPHPTRKGETYKYGHEWIYQPIDKKDLKEMKELLA